MEPGKGKVRVNKNFMPASLPSVDFPSLLPPPAATTAADNSWQYLQAERNTEKLERERREAVDALVALRERHDKTSLALVTATDRITELEYERQMQTKAVQATNEALRQEIEIQARIAKKLSNYSRRAYERASNLEKEQLESTHRHQFLQAAIQREKNQVQALREQLTARVQTAATTNDHSLSLLNEETIATLEKRAKEARQQVEGLEKELSDAKDTITDLKKKINDGLKAAEHCDRLERSLVQAEHSRRALSEKFFEVRGCYRAAVVIKPLSLLSASAADKPSGSIGGCNSSHYHANPSNHKWFRVPGTDSTAFGGCVEILDANCASRMYSADLIIGPEMSAQADEVWRNFELQVESAWYGSSVVFLTYGRTGTGKSHLTRLLWDRIARTANLANDTSTDADIDPDTDSGRASDRYRGEMNSKILRVSAVEIYHDRMYDLLQPHESKSKSPNSKTHENNHALLIPKGAVIDLSETVSKNNGLVNLADTTAVKQEASNSTDLKAIFDTAQASRTNRKTQHNDHSSRSHAIFVIKLLHRSGQAYVSGEVILVDLAGQEKAADSGADKDEVAGINTSLTALSSCLAKLWEVETGSQKCRSNTTSPSSKLSPSAVWKQGGNAILPKAVGGLLLSAQLQQAQDQPAKNTASGKLVPRPKLQFVATVDLSDEARVRESKATLQFVEGFMKRQ